MNNIIIVASIFFLLVLAIWLVYRAICWYKLESDWGDITGGEIIRGPEIDKKGDSKNA